MASSADERRHQSGPFTLPSIATMTSGMPNNKSPSKHHSTGDQMRDSGMWSMQSPSKHSSTVSSATGFSGVSSNGIQLHSILNNQDDSPTNRFSSASLASHNSARHSGHQPPLPTLNRSYTTDNNPRASIDANNTFFIDSRRSSIDSRSNVNLDNLALSSNSPPFESRGPSHRASETSLASSYRDSRGSNPPSGAPRSSNGVFTAPVTRRPITSGGQPPRRAPVIQNNPRSQGMPNPTASTPTRGYAWAFPDEIPEEDKEGSPEISRQPSIAASSINTIESNLNAHKSLASLQDIAGSGNYSRTPELRVSHKLAERKRRSEMKDLFDGLNRILPNSPGNKSSKWEVLSKACEYIQGLKDAYTTSQHENDKLRAELEQARGTADENQSLNNEILVMFEHICRLDPSGHKAFGPRTQQLMQQEQQRQSQHPAHRQPYGPMEGVSYGQFDRR